MNENFKVAIIGGGASGLETAREMLQQGLIPTIFEKNDLVGGVWRNDVGNVWTNMRTNLSRFNVSFSNHPWPKETNLFPTGTQVQEYLMNFINKFKLKNYIKCKTNIVSVKQINSDNGWRVTWIFEDLTSEEVFDFVVIATGSFSNPLIPPNYDTELFKGQIIHSINYNSFKSTKNLKDKKVVVIGHSFSASEICADLVEQQAIVINAFSNPHWIIKKFIKIPGKDSCSPIDFLLLNRKSMQDEKKFKSNKELFIHRNSFFSSIFPNQNKNKELYINPYSSNPPLISISETYFELVEQNKIHLKKERIQNFNKLGVTFNDGSHEEADFVIFCTGYRLVLNFLDQHILKAIEYDSSDDLYPFVSYKGTFHPSIKNLAFVGIKKSFFPMIEIQARWASLVFSRKIKLPSSEIMNIGLDEERNLRKLPVNKRSGRIDGLISFIDSIAQEINSLPEFFKIEQENPRLFKILWEGPLSSVHYKLKEKDESIEEVLNEIEIQMNKINE